MPSLIKCNKPRTSSFIYKVLLHAQSGSTMLLFLQSFSQASSISLELAFNSYEWYSEDQKRYKPVVLGMVEYSAVKPGCCIALSVMRLTSIMLPEETTSRWLVGGRWPHFLLEPWKNTSIRPLSIQSMEHRQN